MNFIFGYIGEKSDLHPATVLKIMAEAGPSGKEPDQNEFVWENAGIGVRTLYENAFPSLLENDEYIIAVNGRIDNQELKDLRNAGASDRVLATKLGELGTKGKLALSGEFVIIFLNKSDFSVRILTDHVGTRPVYYTLIGNVFVFATDISAIRAFPTFNVEVNEEWIVDSLIGIKSEPYHTPYASINKIGPAGELVWNKTLTVSSWWQPDVFGVITDINKESALEQFLQILKQAVNERRDGQCLVGAELSGGLDSSSISALLAREADNSGAEIIALSHILSQDAQEKVFPYKDESPFSKELAGLLKIKEHIVSEGNEGGILNLLRRSIHIHSGTGQGAYFMLSDDLYQSASNAGIHLLFSGFGGDEAVSARRGGLIQEIVLGKDWDAYRQMFLNAGKSNFKDYLKYYLFRYTPLNNKWILQRKDRHERYLHRLAQLAFTEEIGKNYNVKNRYRIMKTCKYPESMNDLMFQRLMSPATSNRLQHSHIAAQKYHLEYVYPLLDRELLEFYFTIPWQHKISVDNDRLIMRESMKQFLPDSIRLRRDKTGTTVPSFQYQILQDHDRIQDLILSSKFNNKFHYLDYNKMLSWQKHIEERKSTLERHVNPVIFINSLQILLLQEMERTGEFRSGIKC